MTATLYHARIPSGALHLRTHAQAGWGVDNLCGFASRKNPKRAFLFISKVLGKHIPVRPSVMRKTHTDLARQLQPFLAPAKQALFIGFAETATGLGAGVFEACRDAHPALEALFVQTTRYTFEQPVALHFQEEHSHATGHLVYQPHHGAKVFHAAQSLVLVDDELTTGKTCINFLMAFLQVNPHIRRVALVSLVSWVPAERLAEFQAALPHLELTTYALLTGAFEYHKDPAFICPPMPVCEGAAVRMDQRVPESFGRFGYNAEHPWKFAQAAAKLSLDKSRPVHVIGDGEFMHLPFRFASFLEANGFDAYVQTTTRSPILQGGAIASYVSFDDHYGEGITNYLYNPPGVPAQAVLFHEVATPPQLTQALPALCLTFQEVL
jgi:hypothetical protein